MKAKIINNEIIYESNFMFIYSINMWVSYPTQEMLMKEGYKEIEILETENINSPNFEEFENKIIIYQLIE